MNHSTRTSPASRVPTGRRRTNRALATLFLTAAVLTGCTIATPAPAHDSAGAQELLEAHDLEGLDVGQIIERLEALPLADRPDDLLASVQLDALVLSDGNGREARLPMPDDEVYISVAPFQEQTHECHFHSLTTCVGELRDAEIRVTLTDGGGEVLIDEIRRTSDNGFTGLWVPRGAEATVTVEYADREGTALLSTKTVDDPTCITTLQLL